MKYVVTITALSLCMIVTSAYDMYCFSNVVADFSCNAHCRKENYEKGYCVGVVDGDYTDALCYCEGEKTARAANDDPEKACKQVHGDCVATSKCGRLPQDSKLCGTGRTCCFWE